MTLSRKRSLRPNTVNKQPRSKLTGYCVELPEIIDFIAMLTKSLQAAENMTPSDSKHTR